MTRLILAPLALLLLLVVSAALLLPMLVDEDRILALAASALHEHTGATLTVDGDARLSLLPTLGVALSDAAVTLPERQQPDLRIRSLDIGLRLLPLLSRRLEVDTVSLDGVVVRVDAAQPNTPETSSKPDIAAGAGTALAVPLALNVKQLLITDSRLEWVDADTTTIVELVKLQASDLNLAQQPIPVELTLRRPGERPVDLNASGTIRLDEQMRHIKLEDVAAVLSGATDAPLTVRSSGSIDLEREAADLQIGLELGETRGQGSLRYASAESPRITARLRLNLFDPALLALAGPEAAAAASAEPTSGSGEATLPLDALRLIDTLAVLDIDQARIGAHTVNTLHAELRGSGGVIELSQLTGELHGGKLEASATLDGRQDFAALTTGGSLHGVDLAAALAAAQAKPILSGRATLDWQLDSRGHTVDELKAGLLGPVKLTTEDVVLLGTSVEKLLCQTVALTNREALTATFADNTRFQHFTADIQVANGQAALDPLSAQLPGIALTGTGRYDLLAQDFDATFKARLSPELEQVDHACRVSKRLLAIDWPVQCAGHVDTEPARWCRVDASKIVQDLTVNEGREKLEKKASKLLDKLFNNKD